MSTEPAFSTGSSGPLSDDPQPARRRSRGLIFGGVLILLILLSAAAFLAGQMLNRPAPDGSGQGQIRINGEGGQFQQSISLEIEDAPELPKTDPDTRGMFVRREDNRLFIGTGNIMMMASMGEDNQMNLESSYDGPVVEVVVTGDTQVFRDDTFQQNQGNPPPDGGKIQQVVSPGDPNEIAEDSSVTVWGKLSGDRVIADILVYTPPAVFISAEPPSR